jgi:hypothetical protein
LFYHQVPPGESATTSTNRIMVWQSMVALGTGWTQQQASLGSHPPSFQLVFEYVQAGLTGDLAIDDVSFSPECQQGANETSCASNQVCVSNK